MSTAWTCDRNHRWSVAADAATLDGPPTCPECGSPGRPISGDETLPPSDEPFPIPSLADVHVPGYELLAELGRGAMGVVYRAREEKLGRPVALKMILAGGHASAADRARFKREAEAVAALRHPNIVQIYAVGESGGLPFCALEFIEGGNLADHAAGKPLPPEEAAALVEQLARGVQFAHEHGIVHRDLKPANILLELASGGRQPSEKPGDSRPPLADFVPKIADFGLAKKIDSATGPTATGAVLGTPAYMAPEQAGGEGKSVVGPAADTYALGAILYELLTGRPPFKAATPLDTILQVLSKEPPPPRSINPKIPRDLETVVQKCLRKEPNQRYASAAELAEDLRRWQAGGPVTARPQGRGAMMWRSIKRNRNWLILGGATAVMGICVLVMSAIILQLLQKPSPPLFVSPPKDEKPFIAAVSNAPAAESSLPAPTTITAATLEQAKQAVVAIVATSGENTSAGTGFLAVEPGIVVTTLSALGMDHPLSPPPDRIHVIFKPGGKESLPTSARLLSVDRTESLACLQISAVGLAPPLAVSNFGSLQEGQKVWIVGYANLSKGQPTPGTRPTLRDKTTRIAGRAFENSGSGKYWQLAGTSDTPGGAVISAEGRLVGVLVTIPGSHNLVAAPSESVGWLLRERVQSLRLGQTVITEKGLQLPVTARIADPLNRLWKLSLDVWIDDIGPARAPSDGKVGAQAGGREGQSFPFTPIPNDRAGPGEDRDFVGTLDLPPLPTGKAYWVRPHFRTSRGTESLGEAVMLPDAGPPVERVPVRLKLNPSAWPSAERRLDLSVNRKLSFTQGDRKDLSDVRDFTATISEQAVPPQAGEAARLQWQFRDYRLNVGDMPKLLESQFQRIFAALAKTEEQIVLSGDGTFTSTLPDYRGVELNVQLVDTLVRELTETLGAVNPPLSTRDLRPGDSWATETPFAYPASKTPPQAIIHRTNTYVGVRNRGGRREAIIEVSGDATPLTDKDGSNAVGRTVGAFAVDVQSGQVVLAYIESDMILYSEIRGLGEKLTKKTKIGMVLETRFQRGPADGPKIPSAMPLPNGRIDFRPFVPLPGTP